MAITLGQLSAGNTAAATSVATTFATNPATGNKLIVYIWSHEAASPTGVTDNASTPNTYTKDAEKVDATGGGTCHIYRADAILLPTSGSLVITATFAASHSISVVARELDRRRQRSPGHHEQRWTDHQHGAQSGRGRRNRYRRLLRGRIQ